MSQKLFHKTDLPKMSEVSRRLQSVEDRVNSSMRHGGIRGYNADAHIRINKEGLITVILNVLPLSENSTSHAMAVAFAHGVIATAGYDDVLVKPAV